MDRELVEAILADYRTAPIDERLRATLAFLETLTLSPSELGPEAAERARRAGAGDDALREAVYVAFVFNVIDRLADAFDFDNPAPEKRRTVARYLYEGGYRATSLRG